MASHLLGVPPTLKTGLVVAKGRHSLPSGGIKVPARIPIGSERRTFSSKLRMRLTLVERSFIATNRICSLV